MSTIFSPNAREAVRQFNWLRVIGRCAGQRHRSCPSRRRDANAHDLATILDREVLPSAPGIIARNR